MTGILHRYMFVSVAGVCASAVGLFGFVILAGQALKDLVGYVVSGQMEPETALRLLVLLLPYVGVYALPVGVLAAVLLTLGRMSSQQEITAMRAAGLGLGYITRPVWVVALIGVAVATYLNFEAMPRSRYLYRTTLVESVRQKPDRLLVPRVFVRDFPGFVVFVGEREGEKLRDFWLWRLDARQRVVGMVRAESGEFRFRDEDDVLVLALRDATVETRDPDRPEDFSRPRPIASAAAFTVELRLENLFARAGAPARRLNWMTWGQLQARERELAAELGNLSVGPERRAAAERELARVRMVRNDKAASSLAVLAFAFVAVPLGIKVSRKETSANLALAVGLMLVYFFLGSIIQLTKDTPSLRPELWVWLPPLLYVAAGAWLFRKLDRP